MTTRRVHAVTGAFGYSGRFIARRLLDAGHPVRTLTSAAARGDPFGGRVDVRPFDFDDPPALTRSLSDVAVLYNTYWVRFNHRRFTRAAAVTNTRTLFRCAADAGVERIVHVSITNPAADSPLEYFRSKARLEAALDETGISRAILRPAVLFGGGDVLVNNIAWVLRRLPIFGVFGDGAYGIQPIHVDDLACLAVEHGGRRDDATIEAIGPETFTYRGLVEEIGAIIGRRRRIVSVSPRLGFAVARGLGLLVRDVVLTRDEIEGLMAGRLRVDAPPAGATRLTDWARAHADELGRRYASELARRRRSGRRRLRA